MCRQLRDKSVVNLDAAQLLKEKNYHYCSSIHCSYYSCFQAIKFILLSNFKINEQIFEARRITSPSIKRGTHDLYIYDLYGKLQSENLGEDAKNFKNSILALQTLRVQSDYKPVKMDKSHSDHAYNLAIKIQKILKRIYKYEN